MLKKLPTWRDSGSTVMTFPVIPATCRIFLRFVEQLNGVDTTGVEPLAHPLEATQRLRPDVVTEGNNREHFQQVAPETESGLYLVPQVIE